MRRVTFALIAIFSLPVIALAHGGVEHMKGTVTELTEKAIMIAMPDQKIMSISIAADTVFEKSGKAVTARDVKVGDRVVVDVVMKGKDAVAKAVKFGPSPAGGAPVGHPHKPGQK